MARKKSNKFVGTFQIFLSSFKTYFLYLDQLLKYMAFPVLGQLISVILMFTLAYYFRLHLESLSVNELFSHKINNLYILFFIILFPLILVFMKSFYEYLIAFTALNTVFYTANKNKAKKIDFKACNSTVTRRLGSYVFLMLLVSLLFIVPPIAFFAPIVAFFLTFVFQVFAIENGTSAINAIKRSFQIVAENILPTLIMLILCYISTYEFLPKLFVWVAEKTSILYFFMNMWENFFEITIISNIRDIIEIVNSTVSGLDIRIDAITISRFAVEATISFIVVAFTLPLRCCCFTELYRLCDSNKIKEISKESDEIISRATSKKRKN